MKKLLLALAILLLLAGVAFAANKTWTNATEDDDWTTAGNWTGGIPIPGTDIAVFDGSEGARGLPTVNLLDLSTVAQYFWFLADYSTHDFSEFTSDAGGSCAAAVGLVGAGVGKIRVDNIFDDMEAYNGTVLIKAGATATGDIGLWGTGTLAASGAGAILDGWVLAPVGSSDGGVVNWGSGDLTVNGGVDAWVLGVLKAFTHQNTTGATLTCDSAGELALGGAAPGLIVAINAPGLTVTSRANESISTLFIVAGTLAGNSKSWTVGTGGFTFINGTISGTLSVNLSAAAGTYVQTAGTIATGGILNVTTGSGGFAWTDIIKTGTGAVNITVAESGSGRWPAAIEDAINLLTINSGKTLTQNGSVAFLAIVGSGTLTSAAQGTYFYPSAAGAWAFSGTTTGTSAVTVRPVLASLVLTNAMNVGTRPVVVGGTASYANDCALTIPGLTCGNLSVYSGTAAKTQIVTLTGNSSGAAISLGSSTNLYGNLIFGSGAIHRWTGAIARGGTGTANALNPQGRCIFTGTFNGTGVSVTPTYEGQIDCQGTGRVMAVTSTGRRLVVRSAVDASGMPLRSWNADSCVNVMFKGRKVVGEPGVN